MISDRRGLIIGLTILFVAFSGIPSVALTEEWVLYGKPDTGSLVAYYDKAHIVPIGDKMLRVTVKYTYSEAGKKDVIASRKRSELPVEGYQNLSHSIVQYELDCGKSQQAIFAVREIDVTGRELDHYNPPSRVWSPVKPGGIGGALLKRVCR